MNSDWSAGLQSVSTLIISGPVATEDIPSVVRRVRMALERSEDDLIVCDVGALDDPDAATLDLLCRLQLIAKRMGRRLLLQDAGGGLRDLLDLTGLADAMPCL